MVDRNLWVKLWTVGPSWNIKELHVFYVVLSKMALRILISVLKALRI